MAVAAPKTEMVHSEDDSEPNKRDGPTVSIQRSHSVPSPTKIPLDETFEDGDMNASEASGAVLADQTVRTIQDHVARRRLTYPGAFDNGDGWHIECTNSSPPAIRNE